MPWVCASTRPRTSWIDEAPLKVRPEMLSCTSGQAAQPADGVQPERRRRGGQHQRAVAGDGETRASEPEEVRRPAPCHGPVAVLARRSRGDDRVVRAERAPAARHEVLAGAVEEVLPEVGRLEVQRQRTGPQALARREPVAGPGHPAVVADRLQAVAAAGHRVAVLRHGPPRRRGRQRHQLGGGLRPLPRHRGGVHRRLHRGRRVRRCLRSRRRRWCARSSSSSAGCRGCGCARRG